ncbi:MAG TPA: hypothetical protein VJX67_23200, partial [Blastocatellia bacterium]|nr:hypothetical protein [Blastocatellia bacterium]
MRRKVIVGCLVFGIAVFCIQRGLAWPKVKPAVRLIGSWRLTLVPDVPAPGAPSSPIAGLATFTPEGTVIATAGGVIVGPVDTALPDAPPSIGLTPAQGIWQPSPAFGRVFIQLVGVVTNSDGTLRGNRNFSATVASNAA